MKKTTATYRSIGITVDDLLKNWMNTQSVHREKSLSAIVQDGTPAGIFVENELLVNSHDKETLSFLADQYGGEIIESAPVPPAPPGMEKRRQRSVEEMPSLVTVKIKGEDIPWDPVQQLAEQHSLKTLQFTSEAGAGTLAVYEILRKKQLGGLLNFAGSTTGFPLSNSIENLSGDNDAYRWPEYAGKANITRAWQLFQAYANVKNPDNPIFIGILDTGYSLNPDGQPFMQPFDYATGPQFNLTNEGTTVAGPSSIGAYAFHGSATAGVAAAIVNNRVGAAGVGGIPVGAANLPLAMPFLFRTNITVGEILRCLQLCVAWGIDVLNMSISIRFPKILLPIHRDWESSFEFAASQGLIMVASASNDGWELPENVVFPATRTPGVITVGALDANVLNARGDSNYGSSVDVWAPGTNIHTVPDPTTVNPLSSNVMFSQTSAAAPIVSGLSAIMKSINPFLKSDDVRQILRETAHTDSPDPKSNRILNGYAALLRTMNHALPPGISEEPNNDPASAVALLPGPDNILAPVSETTLSNQADQDWYHFTTGEYADITITLNFVAALSFLRAELVPDEQDSLVFNHSNETRSAGQHVLSFKEAAPGLYRIAIKGNSPNYYKLRVEITPRPLQPDIFERNESKEASSIIHLRSITRWDMFSLRHFYQGAYEANIQNQDDVDWYHITDIGTRFLSFPVFQLLKADFPLNIRWYEANGNLINEYTQVKSLLLRLQEPECWIEIRAPRATRYSFFAGYQLDKSKLPGPFKVHDIQIIPEWWPDPPFVLDEWDKLLAIEITEDMIRYGKLDFTSDAPLTSDLLSMDGTLITSGAYLDKDITSHHEIGLDKVLPGRYMLRVGRPSDPANRFDPGQQKNIRFRLGPRF